MTLVMGLVTGIFFGAFLQQGEALRFERQVGAMRLIDMTIVKFMLTTIVVGSIGIHLLSDLGALSFAPRSLSLGLQIVGGLLFAFLYPAIQTYVRPIGSFGALSLPQLLGVNHWLVIAALAIGSFFLFRFFERKGL